MRNRIEQRPKDARPRCLECSRQLSSGRRSSSWITLSRTITSLSARSERFARRRRWSARSAAHPRDHLVAVGVKRAVQTLAPLESWHRQSKISADIDDNLSDINTWPFIATT